MFVTLRRNEDSLSIERKDCSPSHQACETCRAKKMRCSGQRNGCHRCLNRGLSCEYPLLVHQRGHKRRRMNSRGTPDTSPLDGHVIMSGTTEMAHHTLTPSSKGSSQDLDLHAVPRLAPGDLDIANVPATTSIREPGCHTSAISELFCDFVGPYAPTTLQSKLSMDDMCTSISATAGDAQSQASVSCLPFKTPGSSPSAAQRPPSIAERPVIKSCRCVSFMLSLLEASEIEGDRLALGTIDRFLRLNKHGLAQINRVLDCQECCSNSELVMLIIIICRTMVSQHERMYEILVHQYEKLKVLERQTRPSTTRADRVDRAEVSSGTPNAPVTTMGIVALNDYEVDAFEEPCVFGGLATMQQRALLRFMAQLRQLCVKLDWHTHREMLLALEERVKRQLLRVSTYHEDSL